MAAHVYFTDQIIAMFDEPPIFGLAFPQCLFRMFPLFDFLRQAFVRGVDLSDHLVKRHIDRLKFIRFCAVDLVIQIAVSELMRDLQKMGNRTFDLCVDEQRDSRNNRGK